MSFCKKQFIELIIKLLIGIKENMELFLNFQDIYFNKKNTSNKIESSNFVFEIIFI